MSLVLHIAGLPVPSRRRAARLLAAGRQGDRRCGEAPQIEATCLSTTDPGEGFGPKRPSCTPAEPWHVEEATVRVRLGNRAPTVLQAVSGVEDAAQKRERADHVLRD